MSLNILINEIVGIIPGLGDAFSFWFKSNKRNYELLLAHTAAPQRARASDWLFVIVVLAAPLSSWQREFWLAFSFCARLRNCLAFIEGRAGGQFGERSSATPGSRNSPLHEPPQPPKCLPQIA
jgi:hypothetical protein